MMFGLTINEEKSRLTPLHSVLLIGAILDATVGKTFIPDDWTLVLHFVDTYISEQQVPVSKVHSEAPGLYGLYHSGGAVCILTHESSIELVPEKKLILCLIPSPGQS